MSRHFGHRVTYVLLGWVSWEPTAVQAEGSAGQQGLKGAGEEVVLADRRAASGTIHYAPLSCHDVSEPYSHSYFAPDSNYCCYLLEAADLRSWGKSGS